MPVFAKILLFFYTRRMRRTAKRVLMNICRRDNQTIFEIDPDNMDPSLLVTDPGHAARLAQEFPNAAPEHFDSLAAFVETLEKMRQGKLHELRPLAMECTRRQEDEERTKTVYDENGNPLIPEQLAGTLAAQQNGLAEHKRKMAVTRVVAFFYGLCLAVFSGTDGYIVYATQMAFYGDDAYVLAIGMTLFFITLIGIFTFLGSTPLFQWAMHLSKATPSFVPPTKPQIRVWLGCTLAAVAVSVYVAVQRAHVYLDAPGFGESVMNLVLTGVGLPVVAVVAHHLYDLFIERIQKYAAFKNAFDQMLTPAQKTEHDLTRAMVGIRRATPFQKQAKRLNEKEFEQAKKAAYHALCRLPMISSEIDRLARLIAETVAQTASPNANTSAAPQSPPVHTVHSQVAPISVSPGPAKPTAKPAPTPTSAAPVQATGQIPPPTVVPAAAAPLNIVGSVSKNGTAAANSKGQTTP